MTIQHNAITDPDIHEPKGVASSASGKVYKANGSGSGTWEYPVAGQDTALSGQVMMSDGTGGGAWEYPPAKAHASMTMTNGYTAHTLASGSAFTLLNPSGEWEASGAEEILTVTPANGVINLTQAGHYFISFWANFTTTALASGTEYYLKYAIDGTTSSRLLLATKSSNGEEKLSWNGSGIISATAGQQLSVYVGGDATSSSNDITVNHAGLTALFLD